MGADLVMTSIHVYGKSRLKDREGMLLDAVEQLTEKDLNSKEYEDFWTDLAEEVPDDYIERDMRKSVDTMKIAIKDIITEFFNSLEYRNVTSFNVPTGILYVSGEMSWGDSPEGGYPAFCKLACLPDSLLKQGEIGTPPSLFELFLEEYGEKMPEDLKKQLMLFKGALQI